MSNNLFNLILDARPYKENPEFFRKFIQQMKTFGLNVVDAKECPIVETATGKEMYESLIVTFEEVVPGVRKELKEFMEKGRGYKVYEFTTDDGLPAMM